MIGFTSFNTPEDEEDLREEMRRQASKSESPTAQILARASAELIQLSKGRWSRVSDRFPNAQRPMLVIHVDELEGAVTAAIARVLDKIESIG